MNIISCDGIWLPAPDEYKPQSMDFDSDDTNRSKAVKLHRKRIMPNVWTIPCKWTNLNATDFNKILSSVQKEKFQVKFFFPCLLATDGYITKNMYAGNKTYGMSFVKSANKFLGEISFNLIDFAD